MNSEADLLSLARVSKNFSGLRALSEVSFGVPRGTITALIGPNGAGKSTAFNLVSGLEPVTSGNILFDGRDITRLEAYRRCHLGIGRTFQTPKIFAEMSIFENVMVGMHGRTRSGLLRSGFRLPGFRQEERRIRERSLEALRTFGLDQLRDQPAESLPFGLQRLLELARIMVTEARIILLDEPTAGLTPAETDDFAGKLMRIRRDGVTVLIVEHDLKFITGIADRIVVLNYGRKIYDGSAAGLREDAGVVEAYIGTKRERRRHAEG